MKVTVCELPNILGDADWLALVEHVRQAGSELVLLPEMPFFPWPMTVTTVDPEVWQSSVRAHEHWLERLDDLAPATVAATRPVNDGGGRYNEGFVWDAKGGYQAAHRKAYLPNDEGFWEATWYDAAPPDFAVANTAKGRLGFMICTEMWFTQHAIDYAQQGVHFLLSPRASPLEVAPKWVAGGRAAAVMAGAYCLGSNRGGVSDGIHWGSHGWIIDPEGEVLGLTSAEEPFVTRDLDLAVPEQAKQTYPRYIYVA